MQAVGMVGDSGGAHALVLRAALQTTVQRLAPVNMDPSRRFLPHTSGRLLRVIDENAAPEASDAVLVESRVPGSCRGHRRPRLSDLNHRPKIPGMIQPLRFPRNVVVNPDSAFVNREEFPPRLISFTPTGKY